MNPESWRAARSLFESLLDLDPADRERELGAACAGDDELMQRVREMLAIHNTPGDSFAPPTAMRSGSLDASTLKLPTSIGGYEIVRQIGAGGMGTVYEARQLAPRRAVALKIMRSGLTGAAAVGRFNFEVEVLARLEHPYIARIFEAGTQAMESGAAMPWFAMEFVEGSCTLFAFAKREDLSLEQRLRLFLKVCEGVHHGHQKGVIHRDLKSPNILVDHQGAPKIIDFGVARSVSELGPSAAGGMTFAGELVGTLGTMSPEQLAGRSCGVDTRTDVYALGALLFELVARKPAVDLSGMTLVEAIELLRERGPRAPSEVRPGLPVELDWIVLKAMRAEREERYASAAALAEDLERLLAHVPVLAGPLTASYRARKFVRRNRLGVGLAAGFVVLLVGGLAWISSLYITAEEQRVIAEKQTVVAETERQRASDERDRAEAINEFMGGSLYAANPSFDGPDTRVVDVLERVLATSASMFGDQPEVRADLLLTTGLIYQSLGVYEKARAHLEESQRLFENLEGKGSVSALLAQGGIGGTVLDEGIDTAGAVTILREVYDGLARSTEEGAGPGGPFTLAAESNLGAALSYNGEDDEAEVRLRHAYTELRDTIGAGERSTILCQSRLALFLHLIGNNSEAEPLFLGAIAGQDKLTGAAHPDAFSLRNNYSSLLMTTGRASEALAIMADVYKASAKSLGPDHRLTRRFASGLGQAHMATGDFEGARTILAELLATCEEAFGPLDPLTLMAHLGLGTSLYYLKDYEGAEVEMRAGIAGFVTVLGELDPMTQRSRNNLAMILAAAGQTEEAEVLLRANLQARRVGLGDRHLDTLRSINNLGHFLLHHGGQAEGHPLLEEAFEARKELLGMKNLDTLYTLINLADSHQSAGRLQQAITLWREVQANAPGVLDDADPRLAYAFAKFEEALAQSGK